MRARRVCGLAALASLASAPAAAQPPAAGPFDASAPQNREVLPAFSYATVEPVLAQIGARYERAGTDAQPALTITFINGRRAAILFGSCLGTSCRAVSIQAVWNAPPGVPADRLATAVAGFNQRYAFSRAFVAADGRPSLQRYLTADFGFIRGNLAVNLIVFAGQIDRFVAEVIQAPLQAVPPVAPAPPSAAPAGVAAPAPAQPADPAAPRRRPDGTEAAPRT
ncbi:YbjN domain-containing protein [Allosphingosinicella sp.]|uniref:YbjN domain-containing protein n=1 Tax=Allosphingosinicella sp. TaxID=2823234 RepID=UPI0037835E72